jgi:hypothetical protein
MAICFPDHGFHLLFDGHQQRLRLIEVHDTTRLQVRHWRHLLNQSCILGQFWLRQAPPSSKR